MVLRFAGFELDQQRAELRGPDGKAIKLRPKTFDMLGLFANAGRVLSKKELMEAVWPNIHVGEDSLFQCIRELRTALSDDQRQVIKLVSGRGYLLDAEVSTEPPGVAAMSAGAESAEPVAAAAVLATPDLIRGSGQRGNSIDARAGHSPEPGSSARAAPTVQLAKALRPFGLRGAAVLAATAGLGAVVGLAVAAPIFGSGLFKRTPPTIAVMPIAGASDDRQVAAMAARVTAQLTDGLARIDNIRVVAPRQDTAAPQTASGRVAQADFVVTGELQKGEQAWTFQVRMVRTADHEVQPVASIVIDIRDSDFQLQQSRLAAGIGHPLALRINSLLDAGARPGATEGRSPPGSAKVVIEQATASIMQTTRERFAAAQAMLEKALAGDPDNVDLAVALAALQLRGVQMVWYSPEDRIAAENNAKSVLERALRAKPNHIPVLEAYCRFLTTTNHFVESLVACARTLSFDPWNGLALYHIGLAQLQLGRFEDALATFQQADRFDTPQVSRWTWLLGAGWAYTLMDHNAEALPWLQRSIAITPASGRPHMLLAAVYQRLGRTDEAKAAMKKALELRPGSTASNIRVPTNNASPVFLEASQRVIRTMVEAGLPER